ncbi:MAG: transglycosylase domain-containing protein [Flexilinea sp.]
MENKENNSSTNNSEIHDGLQSSDEQTFTYRSRKFHGENLIKTETESGNFKLIKKITVEKNLKPLPKIFLSMLIGLAGLLTFFCLLFLVWYLQVATTLPDVDDLQAKASQFETTRILDREGNLLYEIIDPNAGRRDYVTLDNVSPFVVAATIATEDKDFYNHPGFDITAIVRALIQNIKSGSTVSGASTITQQLARNLLLSPEERSKRSIMRKTKEIFLAAEITRRYSKNQILELYLNENYYSNFAYGIEAAAQTYFGIPAKYLDLSQSAFLAGLPQAPGIYDVFTNYDATIERQKSVLLLIYILSKEQSCIKVGNSDDKVCVDEVMIDNAIKEIETNDFEQTDFKMKYPHWVNYIRSILENEYGAQTIYRSGFTVYTTIDPTLQDLAQQSLSDQISGMSVNDANNGAMVVIKPDTGEILAMVGSPDFSDQENSGQVNMAVSPRQPGSSIKPFIYAAAFERGWTPATLIWDVPTDFSPTGDPDELTYSQAYTPVNYDGIFHGPVLLRDALANSYNIPAVKALDYVQIYDNPATENEEGFIAFAKRMHLSSLDKPDYGLSLALGGGEVTLLEMTNAFGIFANNGAYLPATAIKKILNNKDEVIYENQIPEKEQVLQEEFAYQINSILSDSTARSPMFGSDSVLNLSFDAAVKTGTTNDYRDNWTIGYTPDLVTGVWIGNADYTPMFETTGISGAAPVWASFMENAEYIVSNNMPTAFKKPSGIVDMTICSISGAEPSQYCPEYKNEIFAYFQPPINNSEDIWKIAKINTWTGLLANEYCTDNTTEAMTLNVKDIWARRWLLTTQEGHEWASSMNFLNTNRTLLFTPEKACDIQNTNPIISFANITEGMEIKDNTIDIYAVVNSAEGIQSFSLEFGKGNDPKEWYVITNGINQQIYNPEKIGEWKMDGLENGEYTLRIYVTSPSETYAERKVTVRLNIQKSEPTPMLIPVYGDEAQNEAIPEFFLSE